MSRPWMPLYVGDFLADTQHLGATETGIYMRLIMHCWQHGSIPLDDRKLALIAHCDTRLWHQYRETVLQFFDVVDASTAQHKRVSTELRRCEEISNKRKAAAEQKRKNISAKDMHLQTQLQPQSQSHSSLRSEKRRESAHAWPFDDFWTQYPHKVGKADALKAFRKVERSKSTTFEAIMLALMRYAAKRDDRPWCNPATWLNQGRWDDEPARTTGTDSSTRLRQGAAESFITAMVGELSERADSRFGAGNANGRDSGSDSDHHNPQEPLALTIVSSNGRAAS